MIIFWPCRASSPIYETHYSYRFCPSATEELTKCRLVTYDAGTTLAEIHNQIASSRPFCIVTDPEIIIPASALEVMENAALETKGIVGPLFNLSDHPGQVASLPFPYVDKFTFIELAQHLKNDKGLEFTESSKLDPGMSVVHPTALKKLPSSTPLKDAPGQSLSKKFVCIGALVHKFGEYYSAQREDLINLVPEKVRDVLDVGCARGGYGRMLKSVRPDIHITGVELNPSLAEEAKRTYDQVVQLPLEEANLDKKFDLVNMGDVLEHLFDPWKMLKKIASLLKPGGWLAGSIPNSGHWSIARQLVEGEFEYIPVGLLCVSHIRFFTESSLVKNLKEAGFEIDVLDRHQPPPTPKGQEFIDALVNSGFGNRESLLTAEIIFRARLKND